MPDNASQHVWVVVRVRKGTREPQDSTMHTGFTDPTPAHLLCDILNDKNQNSRFEFRVLEMPRFQVTSQQRAAG